MRPTTRPRKLVASMTWPAGSGRIVGGALDRAALFGDALDRAALVGGSLVVADCLARRAIGGVRPPRAAPGAALHRPHEKPPR